MTEKTLRRFINLKLKSLKFFSFKFKEKTKAMLLSNNLLFFMQNCLVGDVFYVWNNQGVE